MAQVKDGSYLASGGSLVGERPVAISTIKLSDGTSVQWARGYNLNWPVRGLLDEGVTFVPGVAMPSNINCAGCDLPVEDDPHVIKEWSSINERQYWHSHCFVREHVALQISLSEADGGVVDG